MKHAVSLEEELSQLPHAYSWKRKKVLWLPMLVAISEQVEFKSTSSVGF